MAWMAGNIFLSTRDSAAVTRATAELLASPAHAADPEHLLGAPAPVVVSPAHDGWVAVTGARAFFDELPWVAAELSRACATTAVSCELIGNSYAMRFASFDKGVEQREQHTPHAGWSGGGTSGLAEMPLYEDAEQLAMQALREAGVPAVLAVVGTTPLAEPTLISIGEGTSLRRPGPEPAMQPLEVLVPDFSGEDAPVLPTGFSRDFGLMLFEDRYVEGRPSLAAVDRLLAIEEEILARASRACGPQVSLTVTYHGGTHQALLDQELRARGRPTAAHLERGDRTPWWQFWRHLGRLR